MAKTEPKQVTVAKMAWPKGRTMRATHTMIYNDRTGEKIAEVALDDIALKDGDTLSFAFRFEREFV